MGFPVGFYLARPFDPPSGVHSPAAPCPDPTARNSLKGCAILGTALRHRFAVIFLLCRIIGAESPDVNPLPEILRNRQEAPVFSPPGLVFPTKFSGNFPRLCPGFSGSRQRRRRPQNSASGRHPGRKSPCTGGKPPVQGLPRGGYEKSIATPHRMRRNGWSAALGLLPGGQ